MNFPPPHIRIAKYSKVIQYNVKSKTNTHYQCCRNFKKTDWNAMKLNLIKLMDLGIIDKMSIDDDDS